MPNAVRYTNSGANVMLFIELQQEREDVNYVPVEKGSRKRKMVRGKRIDYLLIAVTGSSCISLTRNNLVLYNRDDSHSLGNFKTHDEAKEFYEWLITQLNTCKHGVIRLSEYEAYLNNKEV